MGTGVLSKGKSVWDVNLTRHFSVEPRLRMCANLSLLLTYASTVCIEEDSTQQPHFFVLITNSSHFTQFLFALFCFNTKIYTIVVGLIGFDIDNP
jgi:hypothetical protein